VSAQAAQVDCARQQYSANYITLSAYIEAYTFAVASYGEITNLTVCIFECFNVATV